MIQALKEYRQNKTFCQIALTNVDLYPQDEWNFVYGLANPSEGCGVFSFARHEDSSMDGENCEIEGESADMTWLRRSLGTMVHEIGHMFGLRHCIVYECTMNGSNGSDESDDVSVDCVSDRASEDSGAE